MLWWRDVSQPVHCWYVNQTDLNRFSFPPICLCGSDGDISNISLIDQMRKVLKIAKREPVIRVFARWNIVPSAVPLRMEMKRNLSMSVSLQQKNAVD